MVELSKRELLAAPLASLAFPGAARSQEPPQPSAAYDLPMVRGRFAPTPESLKAYQTPGWFRDAKFGIWSHWGPQAVPRAGDWYARHMYIPGHPQYDHHVKTYGHPTKHGYKDIIPLWKAEKWDPDALMDLYAAAGAKYFVSMGVHHDNFDLWNSKHHRWNSVKMGPKRDIVGDWKKAALKQGLRFGVSEHLGPSYSWFYPSHMYDQVWPHGGQSYDGADPAYADLYHPPHNEPFRWGRSWYAKNPQWHQIWFNRIKDLLDSYRPDFLYTDGGIPFEIVGRTMLAHFYNANMAAHGGKLDAVYAYKDLGTGEFYAEAGVQDVERGVLKGINALPWQTCTSMGDWFYSEGYKYKTTPEVIHMLSDIVSKNGNMLINVVQYPDGSLPPESKRFLDEMAAWMAVNAEAIHGSRPWKIFGEGPTEAAEGAFKEGAAYTPKDIRFTTKGSALYAITLGEPAGAVAIRSLGRGAGHETRAVKSVRLLGVPSRLTFRQTPSALQIDLPGRTPTRYASVFKIGFA
ncbi:alpha-L-fucosidase [Sphingomonas sp.]|jgi:alpha-L-fucosidase|uniref:alpha-L-fucosidase n=1 Tax=Sphingomonas sp. TaxID=28214 RepID=UPI002ED86072